jgi:hypothetical protein
MDTVPGITVIPWKSAVFPITRYVNGFPFRVVKILLGIGHRIADLKTPPAIQAYFEVQFIRNYRECDEDA